MEACDETTAKVMSDALMKHAKEIQRYARTYCEPTLANLSVDAELRRKFTKTVARMLDGMQALMLLAKYKGVSRFCNVEQIEAYMDEARVAVNSPASVRQSATLLN